MTDWIPVIILIVFGLGVVPIIAAIIMLKRFTDDD